MKAVRAEDKELVMYLIAKGANVRQINNSNSSIFHAAAKNQSATIIKLIAEKFESKIFLF